MNRYDREIAFDEVCSAAYKQSQCLFEYLQYACRATIKRVLNTLNTLL